MFAEQLAIAPKFTRPTTIPARYKTLQSQTFSSVHFPTVVSEVGRKKSPCARCVQGGERISEGVDRVYVMVIMSDESGV